MSLTKKALQARHSVVADLRNFAQVLTKFGLDASSIFSSLKSLTNEQYIPTKKVRSKVDSEKWIDVQDNTLWEYQVKDMQIYLRDLSKIRHLKPEKIEYLNVSLTVICKASCIEWLKEESQLNPFEESSVKVKIYGDKEGSNFQTGFHFDLCRIQELTSEEIHPSYHVQFSPDSNSNDEFNHGNIILIDTPRIVHPPLDLILGFDYILSNFAPQVHKQLLEDGTYNNLVRTYQKKIWFPYFKRILGFWDSREEKLKDDLWHPQNLLPHLRDR